MTKGRKKGAKEKWIDKWDAEIMWWFYDILENELDIVMVHDSTELREMLEKVWKEASGFHFHLMKILAKLKRSK